MIRLVKMTFIPEQTQAFEQLFDEVKDRIRQFPGCQHVELLRDLNDPGVYFTRSLWDREESLEQYRQSGLFAETWSRTRAMFREKPEAWSFSVVAEGRQ